MIAQKAPNSGWNDRVRIGGEIFDEPVARGVHDGRVAVFVRGTQNRLFYIIQDKAAGAFGNWINLGGYIILPAPR
jgi:hypothetical protein